VEEIGKKSAGEKCDVAGLYWSSGCGHANVLDFQEDDIFPNCYFCGKAIEWLIQPEIKAPFKGHISPC
jgi:hypothetical protein